MNKLNNDIWIPELDGWASIDEYIDSIKKNIIDYGDPGLTYQVKFISCSDQDGNLWKEPYLKVSNKLNAETITDILTNIGIDASVDCYEDEDGDGDGGRPIVRKLWSVKLGVKVASHLGR